LAKHSVWLFAFVLVSVAACGKRETRTEPSPFDRFDRDKQVEATPLAPPFEKGDLDEEAPDDAEFSSIETYQGEGANLRKCGLRRYSCVVDGDTVWLKGTKIRIADIDTPEIYSPACPAEKALGEQAAQRLIELLNQGAIEAVPVGNQDEDRYGRKLRLLMRSGRSLGDQLVAEGLARRWSGRREPWC
jgi:endonuclease YncB( thermonuclease family)